MLKSKLLIILFLFLNISNVFAGIPQYENLTDIAAKCGAPVPGMMNACISYLSGIHDAFISMLPDNIDLDCYQKTYKNVNMIQFSLMLSKYLRENPDVLDKAPGDVIINFWVKKYPIDKCTKKK